MAHLTGKQGSKDGEPSTRGTSYRNLEKENLKFLNDFHKEIMWIDFVNGDGSDKYPRMLRRKSYIICTLFKEKKNDKTTKLFVCARNVF